MNSRTTIPQSIALTITPRGHPPNQSYRPWMKKGVIRGPNGGPVEVSVLWDTGPSQSLLLWEKVPKGAIEAARETVQIEGIGGKRMKIPLCKIILKSKWKNGPIQVGVVDKLPMKGISLILGNEVKIKKYQPSKMAKMSAKNGEDKMATEPQVRYNLHRRSQSGKVESKEVKLPHLRKPKNKGTSHQRKGESPTNNWNKFPNTYREDKKIRGPSQMAKKKEFEKGKEVLLLSPYRGPHCDGRYIGPYRVSQKIDERTYRINTHEGRKKTQVCHANRLRKYVHREREPVLAVATKSRTVERKEAPAVKGPPLKLKNSEMLNKFEEKLSHLSVSEWEDLEKLMKKYPGLFSDVPWKCSSRTVFHGVGEEKEKMREKEFSSSKFDI